MKKISLLFFAISVWCCFPAAAGNGNPYSELDSLLARFYYIFQPEDNDGKCREFDKIIEMCGDSLARQYMTMQIFDHYSNSNVMGEEEVAIKIYDSWIASGKVKPRSEFEAIDKSIFVEFNRNSLIGMKAPEITLNKAGGGLMTIPEEGEISILFFYATDCAKCRLEWEFMPKVLERINIPVNFYAINCSTDRNTWKLFRKSFKVRNKNVLIRHLWDPKMESGYQKLYGITGTPKIFVLLEDGEIIGRRLELENIHEMFRYISTVYGREEE